MNQNPVTTIEITDFSGRLTRKKNGDMNSGMADFIQSWGYDPFTKPGNLTWMETATDITGPIKDLIVAGKTRTQGGTGPSTVYLLGHQGSVYGMQPNAFSPINSNLDSVISIASVKAGSPTWNYGGDIDLFGSGATEKIYISSDSLVNTIAFDGSGDAVVGNSGNYFANVFRPLKQFVGKLIFGNGPTIGAIDATNTVTSSIIGIAGTNYYSQLNPPLPVEMRITDMDVSTDGNYVAMAASTILPEQVPVQGKDVQDSTSVDSNIYYWNGSDAGVTAFKSIKSFAVTALHTYLAQQLFFAYDSFGTTLMDGVNKILTLQNVKSPLPNSVINNGAFLTWVSPELNTAGTGRQISIFYFGSLDAENQPGLYRLLRYSTALTSGFSQNAPFNLLVNNQYSTTNVSGSSIVSLGYGKHYFSAFDTSSGTNQFKLFRFNVPPTGTGTPVAGVYQTQTQLFSQKWRIVEARIYCEPTAANNGVQLDFIGIDGTSMNTQTYTFASGTAVDKAQGALDIITFNPAFKPTAALGMRFTNTGTANMIIHKVEIDMVPLVRKTT